MDNKQAAGASFDEIIKAGRKKKEHERLAQEILGKRRASTPGNAKKPGLGGSLASRVGVTKRPTSLSRSQSSQSRLPPVKLDREPAQRQTQRQPQARPVKSNGNTEAVRDREEVSFSGSGGMSIKGAAGGPYIVIASNFAQGTTAADIESVMVSVGGKVAYCKLIASSPTVIAEISFRDRSGAEAVISTFNNKKADGRLLYVSFKDDSAPPISKQQAQAPQPQAEPQHDGDDAMDVDENAKSREAEDKLREQRRGGATRDDRVRPDAFPSGPRNNRAFGSDDDYYYNNRQPAYQQQGYQDGRFGGFGGGYGGRGRFYDDQRSYRGRGGGWR